MTNTPTEEPLTASPAKGADTAAGNVRPSTDDAAATLTARCGSWKPYWLPDREPPNRVAFFITTTKEIHNTMTDLNALEMAVARWLAHPPTYYPGPVTPPVTWEVGPGAHLELGDKQDPFDGAVISAWSKDDK